MTDTWVSRNLYLAELRERARETERQYSEQDVGAEMLTSTVAGVNEDE